MRGAQRLATSNPQRHARCSTEIVTSAAHVLRACLAFGGTLNGRQQNLPSLNGCVYVDDKNFRKSLLYFRPQGRWYDYCLGKVIHKNYLKFIRESASEVCAAN